MTSWVSRWRAAALLLSCVWLSGCLPPAQSQSEEEKEPHFLAGKSRVNAMDYRGAIEAFQNALEVNPRSASAHFELAWLFDQKESDPAAAIYHYEQYLKFRPNAENAEMVKTRILAGKQELARQVSLGPVTQVMQKEFEELAEENKRLREEVEKWRAYFSTSARSPGPSPTNPPAGSFRTPRVTQIIPGSSVDNTGRVASASAATGRAGAAPAPARTHTVKSGETLSLISRRYGVKLDALMAANPGVDPRRLRVGQAVTIP